MASTTLRDAEQRHDVAVTSRLRQHAFASVDQNHRHIGRRCTRHHVARVLLVPRRVGDDELAPVGGEETVGHVDRDALLTLCRETIDQQREIQFTALRAHLLRIRFQRRELILEDHFRLVEQAADERRLAVIHAAAGNEPQQALVLVRLQVSLNVGSDEVGFVGHGQREADSGWRIADSSEEAVRHCWMRAARVRSAQRRF